MIKAHRSSELTNQGLTNENAWQCGESRGTSTAPLFDGQTICLQHAGSVSRSWVALFLLLVQKLQVQETLSCNYSRLCLLLVFWFSQFPNRTIVGEMHDCDVLLFRHSMSFFVWGAPDRRPSTIIDAIWRSGRPETQLALQHKRPSASKVAHSIMIHLAVVPMNG